MSVIRQSQVTSWKGSGFRGQEVLIWIWVVFRGLIIPDHAYMINPFLKKELVMRRVLLIFLSMVLTLVGWSMACADDGFYVIPTMKRNYAPVPKTGQTELCGNVFLMRGLAERSGLAYPTLYRQEQWHRD